jgi:hypothetical protein
LNGIARAEFERFGETRTDDNGVRVVSKFVERSRDDLLPEIGGLEMVDGQFAEFDPVDL